MKTLNLDTLDLAKGSHSPDDGAMCVMEAVAFVANEPWSDHPKCASKVIGSFLRSWNDVLSDDERQMLKPLIPQLVGTAGTAAQEDARAWMCLDWLVRTYTPAWLRLAGLDAQATLLVDLPEFVAGMDVPSIKPTITAVREDARAAWAAARDVAGDAAGAAAWDAAWAAARDVAGDAAGDAAWDAAGDAARAAAGDAAGDAARAAAGDAAWDAAWAAARDVAWAAAWDAAWDAAGDAARAALEPTRIELQQSALALVDRMIAVFDSDGPTGESAVQRPDPSAPLVDVEEDIVEWKCSPILGGAA